MPVKCFSQFVIDNLKTKKFHIRNFQTMGVGEDVNKPAAYVFLMSIGGQSLEENKKHSGEVSLMSLE